MALSNELVQAHIERWERTLAGGYYPHRKGWPNRLFHHAPLENAVSILTSGYLRSRNDPENARARDVAAQEVLAVRAAAHDSVRLYFRPKTPTQYHIEGIRKPGECHFGEATHCPVLVLLALDARTILTMPDVQFSAQNMQIVGTPTGDTEEFFGAIPFEKVFHEGPTGGDDTIRSHRCAEVLTPTPLDLNECLREIYVRSEPERETLLYLLGRERERWGDRCYVSDGLKVFDKKFAFVQEVGLTPEGVTFVLNPREDRRPIAIHIEVWDAAENKVIDFLNDAHAAKPTNAQRWIFKRPLTNGVYRVLVRLEGQLAHHANIVLGDTLF